MTSRSKIADAVELKESTSRQDFKRTVETEYAERQRRSAGVDVYSPFNPAALFMLHQRQRAVLRLIRRLGLEPLSDKRILEIGCGSGAVLLELLSFKASPKKLFGTDLLFDRVARAHDRLSHLPLTCADGQDLPFQNDSFDILLQFTVFSSVLDKEVRKSIAREMLRVVRKTTGVILWYDFWLNPVNKHTVGIGKAELQELFPGCSFTFHRVTLAPPLARAIVPRSWILASILEALRILNTHYLVAIRCGDSEG